MTDYDRIKVADALVMLEEFYEKHSLYDDYKRAQALLVDLSRLALKAKEEYRQRVIAQEALCPRR